MQLLRKIEEEYVGETKKWEEEKIAFKNSQQEANEAIEVETTIYAGHT